jgi:hypothetical protein
VSLLVIRHLRKADPDFAAISDPLYHCPLRCPFPPRFSFPPSPPFSPPLFCYLFLDKECLIKLAEQRGLRVPDISRIGDERRFGVDKDRIHFWFPCSLSQDCRVQATRQAGEKA